MEILSSLNTSGLLLLKIAILFSLLLYIVFSLVVVKQVNLMTDTLDVEIDRFIRFLANVQLIFVMGVFVFSLITL